MDTYILLSQQNYYHFFATWCLLAITIYLHIGVSINGDTQKWMVYKGKSDNQMDDLGVLF